MSITQDIKKLKSGLLSWDVNRIRSDFPIFHDQSLVYLDSAATAQKPSLVIAVTERFYKQENSNVHRGVYPLSEQATQHYESVRETVRDFIRAKSTEEIIFTRGSTDAINLVAHSFGRAFLKAGDEVLISTLEHHANIVPWQLLRDQFGIILKVIPLLDNGDLDLMAYRQLLTEKTRLVALSCMSNAIGTINPVAEMISLAHAAGAAVLLDAAQAAVHEAIDVGKLDCDFLVFSGHKLYGPTGIGVLYGKTYYLDKMPPYQGGGDMIKHVTFEKTHFNDLPLKFEAGTPNIAGVMGLGAAIDYLRIHGLPNINAYEMELLNYLVATLSEIKGVKIIGQPRARGPIVSFELKMVHPHDIATLLGQDNIAVRAGHHCAMPTLQALGLNATTRVSLAFYNTFQDIDALARGLIKIKKMFG